MSGGFIGCVWGVGARSRLCQGKGAWSGAVSIYSNIYVNLQLCLEIDYILIILICIKVHW